MAQRSGPIINITLNASDAAIYSPRAIIAIFPFNFKQVNPGAAVTLNKDVNKAFPEYLKLRGKPIILTDDILNLSTGSDKKGISHSLSAVLVPGTYNYLGMVGPGDWVMAWIVNTDNKKEELLENIRSGKPANGYNSGLKFIGQVHTIQEQFRMEGGNKTIRYNLTATGFNQYNGQIVWSPYALPNAKDPNSMPLVIDGFFSAVMGQNEKGEGSGPSFYAENAKEDFSVHNQIIRFHQAMLGPGPGNRKIADSTIVTLNDTFGLPTEVANLLGKKKRDDRLNDAFTFSDIMIGLIGIQSHDINTDDPDGEIVHLGPDFSVLKMSNEGETDNQFGTYFEPTILEQKLRGKKNLNVTPSMGGSIWNIISEHLNPILNEMYVCLRPSPGESADIFPTFVARQIPSYSSHPKFITTSFLKLPRFNIDPRMLLGYDLCKSEQGRINTFFIRSQTILEMGDQIALQQLNVANGPWKTDINDIKRHGARIFSGVITDDSFDLSETKNQPDLLSNYNDLLADRMANGHLHYTGTVQTIGIQKPICVGENLQLGDVVLMIETVQHTYSVMGNGVTVFRSNMNLSSGIHTDEKNAYDAFKDHPPEEDIFSQIKGGRIKELGSQFNDELDIKINNPIQKIQGDKAASPKDSRGKA